MIELAKSACQKVQLPVWWRPKGTINTEDSKVLKMQTYNSRQDLPPHFSGDSRQGGSKFGSLRAGVWRVAQPFVKKPQLPEVESLRKELLAQSLRELVEVDTR